MNKTGPKVEIFSQGEEVVTGQTIDTNAAWLSAQLVPLGFNITRHTTVGDRKDDLVHLLREIAARADCCICTGGLGPTLDDLTADAVSGAFDLPLQMDATALDHIEAYFGGRGRHMPAANRKQALIPAGGQRLDNDWGTAPGFVVEAGRCWFAFLPGVPSEMRNMFRERVKPELDKRFRVAAWKLITLRTVGIGESAIQERLDGIVLPEPVELGFRSGEHDIQTKLLFPPDFPEPTLRSIVGRVSDAIGSEVFGIDGFDGETGGGLPSVIGRCLDSRGQSVALAETLTGGAVASQSSTQPGFVENVAMLSVERLLARFGIPCPSPDDDGAYADAAAGLAQALRKRCEVDYGLVQLWRKPKGPDGGEPVICLYNALATADGVFHGAGKASGEPRRQQNLATTTMLDLLRRYLQGLL